MSTILVVDDDFYIREIFKELLAKEGHLAYTASTGEAAIELVKEHLPDLVVMDVFLPGMNGIDTFRAIREIEPKIPVIILTAFGTTENAIEATKLGAFDYVLKPFQIPDMLALIERAIQAGRFIRSKVEINGFPETTGSDAIIGKDISMQNLYKNE